MEDCLVHAILLYIHTNEHFRYRGINRRCLKHFDNTPKGLDEFVGRGSVFCGREDLIFSLQEPPTANVHSIRLRKTTNGSYETRKELFESGLCMYIKHHKTLRVIYMDDDLFLNKLSFESLCPKLEYLVCIKNDQFDILNMELVRKEIFMPEAYQSHHISEWLILDPFERQFHSSHAMNFEDHILTNNNIDWLMDLPIDVEYKRKIVSEVIFHWKMYHYWRKGLLGGNIGLKCLVCVFEHMIKNHPSDLLGENEWDILIRYCSHLLFMVQQRMEKDPKYSMPTSMLKDRNQAKNLESN